MAKKNLTKLAKKSTATKKTSTTTASKTKSNDQATKEKKSDAKDRDTRAKQKVEELLRDVKLTKTDDDDLLVVDNKGDEKSVQWLEEQATLLSNEVEKLRSELAEEKKKNKELAESGNSNAIKNSIIHLFNELQDNHIKAGYDSMGRPNFIIRPIAFMNRMVMFFPFLEKIKKF